MQDLLTNFRESGGALEPPNAICKLRLVAGLRTEPDPLGELKCSPRPRGGLVRQETGRFPGGPLLLQEVYRASAYTRMYFTGNQLKQSADRLGIQCTGDDVRRVSLSERIISDEAYTYVGLILCLWMTDYLTWMLSFFDGL